MQDAIRDESGDCVLRLPHYGESSGGKAGMTMPWEAENTIQTKAVVCIFKEEPDFWEAFLCD